MARDISICIATCRRPAGLARLLASLAKLQIPEDVSIEVLVVDNDAEGSGAAVARDWADGPHPLRVLIEPRRNVARARNRAVEAARGSWLAFIDDDEIADEGWLAAYWSRIQEDDCDGWFGPVLPRLEETVTAWMDPKGFFGRRRHPSGTPIGAGEAATSNAFVRRSLFAEMRFDPAFGRPPAFGEDRELFGRMLEAGARFCWCDEAVVTEFIPPARHRIGWLTRRSFHGGFVTTQLERRAGGRGSRARGLARALLGLGLFGLLLPVAALGGRRPAGHVWLRLCIQAGHLWAALVPSSATRQPDGRQPRVALLTNFLPPYRIPLMQALRDSLEHFQILLSTAMEADRSWEADWRDLPVAVQRSFSFRKTWRHPHDFAYTTSVHIPYDTLLRLRRFRPDVVVSSEFGMRTLQAAVYRRLFDPRCRLVIWATLSSVTEVRRGFLRGLLRRWLVTVADAFLVNGRSGRAYLEQIGAPAERITPIPYVCDNAHFASAASRPPDGTRRLLVVGQLIPRKGIEPLLAVAARWASEHADRRIELHFAGEGPLAGCLSAAGRPRNLELRHLGEVDYADLPSVYGGADILVFPTLADEWGVVTNEALAAGLPVLGSVYSQAVDELIEDDVNGWRFRPDHPDEFLTAFGKACTASDERLSAMGSRARASVAALTASAMARRMLGAIASAQRLP